MNNLRVIDLKSIAKSKGLRGYSQLRKAELIDLLTREGVRPKGEVIFVEESQPEDVVNQRLKDFEQSFEEREEEERKSKKKRKREIRKAKKKKREVEKRCREIEKEINFAVERKRVVEKRRKKRESKKRNKKSRSNVDSVSVDIDQLVKEIEEEESRVQPMSDVERAIKRLKKKQRKAKGKKKRSLQEEIDRLRHHSSAFELVESKSALKNFAKQYTIEGREGYGPKRYLLTAKPTILTFLRENNNIKLQLALKCRMKKIISKKIMDGKITIRKEEVIYTEAYFLSKVEINFQGTDVEDLYSKMMHKILVSLETFIREGSGWIFDRVEELHIHTVKYEPLKGSSYIPLPKNLATKKALINMKNMDNECFKWCITRALNPVEKNAERITKILHRQAEKLNWEGLKFPVELPQISRFEKLNNVSVNVYGYEKNVVYPLRVSKAEYTIHVNLLLISEGEKKHYCLIKNMSRLLSTQISKKKAIKFYCSRCLNSFGRQDLLDKHLELCKNNEAVGIKMPEEGTFVSFKNHHKKMDMPFVIYADFESLMKAIHSVQQSHKKSYTEKKVLHKPISFCYYVKCSFDDKFSKSVRYTTTSEDEDVAQIFVDELEKEVKSIYKDHPKKTMTFTKKDNYHYKTATRCWLCDKGFTNEKDWKVRDHCHYTGKYRGAAHNSCNIQFRRPKFTPVIFHNLSGYDAHLFIKNLGVTEGNIDCIPNNEEKYISFTKHVEVDRFTPKGEEKEVIVKRELRFIDSFKFMTYSLDTLVNNLGEKDFVNTSKFYSEEQMKLLKRKGVYPYEWLDSIHKLNETQLPNKEAFYSKMSGEGISDEDYEHAKLVWKTFNMKTMRDYHDLYNKSDVLLLADVFENFRKVCKENYDLDPCWYYTAPGLAWDACLKLTKIQLELLTDPDMLLFFEQGIRGGISMISTRHGKANNKYMNEKFDSSEILKYLVYLDANNLYGYAMSKKLPTGGFQWMTEEELKNWRSLGCVLEVDLEYSEELHDLHNEYPLAPERLTINKVEKLIPNLNNKRKYIIHYENLKLYESLGLKITHIHRGIKFEESDWMKSYIDLNTRLRAEAKNEFEKDFFKLLNNSVFGKTMENIRSRVNVTLVNNNKKAEILTAKPNFKKCTIFSENLCAIHMGKTQIYFNKPVYLGMCILDLSKTLMYDFHYNYIKSRYNEKAKLLFTDTDSLAYEIQTEDFYRDISSNVETMFDTSNFDSSGHPSGIPVGKNKKVVGMFKDEVGGKIIEEFVGLRAKLYAYKMFEGKKEEKKKCKGVKKSVIKRPSHLKITRGAFSAVKINTGR